MPTLGAYYHNQQNELIQEGVRGLGNLSTQDQFALEELQNVLAGGYPGLPATQPIGVFSPWGEQSGSVDWVTVAPDHDLVLYPLSDQQLLAVQKSTFGIPLGSVAVITTTPAVMDKAAAAFDNTPYSFTTVEGIFRLDDTKSVPSIYFLYWGNVRDAGDPGGGHSSMQSAAAILGGQLVFPMQIPRTGQERAQPAVSFAAALATQLSVTSPAAQTATLAVQAQLAPAPAPAASTRPWWLLPLVGAGAAAGGVYLYRKYKKQKAAP